MEPTPWTTPLPVPSDMPSDLPAQAGASAGMGGLLALTFLLLLTGVGVVTCGFVIWINLRGWLQARRDDETIEGSAWPSLGKAGLVGDDPAPSSHGTFRRLLDGWRKPTVRQLTEDDPEWIAYCKTHGLGGKPKH